MTHQERIKVIERVFSHRKRRIFWSIEIKLLKKLEEEGFDEFDFWKQVKLNINSFSQLFCNNFYILYKERKKYLREKEKIEIEKFKIRYFL